MNITMDLNQVTLPCTNYDGTVQFYQKLGLRLIVNSPPHYARFESHSGSTFSIHKADSATTSSDVVIYFEVEDVDAAVNTLKEVGISIDSEPVDQDWLWREAYLRDPTGNHLCIYHAGENRRYPPWRVAGE